MFSIGGMSPVVVQEKIDFKANFTSYRNSSIGKLINEDEMFLKLQRNIGDDTFNAMFRNPEDNYDATSMEYTNRRYSDNSIVSANINGKDYLGQKQPYEHNGSDGVVADPHSFFIHHGMIGDSKFRDVKNFTVKNTFHDERGIIISLFPKFRELKQFVSLKENQYLDIKTLNGAVFDIPANKVTAYGKIYNIPESSVKKYYNHTFVVPRKINRLNYNKTLYDVYSANEIDEEFHGINKIIGLADVAPDVLLKNGSMTSSAFSNKLNFFPTKNSNNNIRDFVKSSFGANITKPKYIGSFEISGHTGYDYDKQKGTFGPSANSKQGELIPYNYEGSYSRVSTLGINEVYKKINIIQSLDNTEPILQPDEGRFMLTIYNDSLPIHPTWKTIDQKLFKKDSKYIYPLLGLERLVKITERRKNEEAV